jgi:CDP-glucose 4,6-dehydratase
VKTGNINPIATFKSNIEGMWNILDAVRMLSYNSDQIKGVIVASSDKAYGTSENLPYTESMPLKGEHPYDVSKSCGDLIAQSYFKTYKIPLSIVRMGNIYGPGDLNYNRIIPGTIKSILLRKNPIIRSDGTYIREYFYVADAVNACLKLAKAVLNKKFWGDAFNFSSGEQYTVIDIVKKIMSIMTSTQEPIILNEARNEIKEQFLSIEKAKRLLNWQPIYTTEEGLRYTIEWYKKEVFR